MNNRAPKLSTTVFSYCTWVVVGLMIGSVLGTIVSADGLAFQKWGTLAGCTFAFLVNIQPRGVRT